MDSPGKNTGVGCHFLLQGIFLTQGSNPGLLHCRKILYQLSQCPTLCNPMDCSPPGSLVHGILQAWILEWVAIPFSRGSSLPRDRTQASCTVRRRFTVWATREAPSLVIRYMQIKTTIRYHFLSLRMAIKKEKENTGEDVKKRLMGMWNTAVTMENSLAIPQKIPYRVTIWLNKIQQKWKYMAI